MLSLLESAVAGKRATGKRAQIPGIPVAGKTGSSDWGGPFASFVGIVPTSAPRYVIFVGVSSTSKSARGGTVAAPAFARVAKRALER
jgi:cell division protein FtsI (penicillin-binding protein 3)